VPPGYEERKDTTTDTSDTSSTRNRTDAGEAGDTSEAGETDKSSGTDTRGMDATIQPPARLALFGFPATPALVRVVPRPRAWRLTHGLLALMGCWVLMPVVVFVPPHVPWVLGAFFTGVYLARRRFTEHYTIQRMEGTCPKCGAVRLITKPTRLSSPLSLSCPQCHQDINLEVDVGGE
jgi:hypothetical protein